MEGYASGGASQQRGSSSDDFTQSASQIDLLREDAESLNWLSKIQKKKALDTYTISACIEFFLGFFIRIQYQFLENIS